MMIRCDQEYQSTCQNKEQEAPIHQETILAPPPTSEKNKQVESDGTCSSNVALVIQANMMLAASFNAAR